MKRIILGVCALLMTGCCSCRKTIVFVGIPSMANCLQPSVSRELRPSTPRFIPRNRRDSLLMEAGMKAKRETDEATRHLNPIMRENKNSPDFHSLELFLIKTGRSRLSILGCISPAAALGLTLFPIQRYNFFSIWISRK